MSVTSLVPAALGRDDSRCVRSISMPIWLRCSLRSVGNARVPCSIVRLLSSV